MQSLCPEVAMVTFSRFENSFSFYSVLAETSISVIAPVLK